MEAIDPSSADALKWRNGRAASTNNPEALSRVSHQAQTRRRHDLIRVFVDALGGRDAVSDVALMQVKKAAELLALAEMVRAKMLGDPGRDVTGLVRLEGEARARSPRSGSSPMYRRRRRHCGAPGSAGICKHRGQKRRGGKSRPFDGSKRPQP